MNKASEGLVHSAIGDGLLDRNGAAVAVARMDVEKSYEGLTSCSKSSSATPMKAAWEEIKTKIDYTYENLDRALSALEKETPFLAHHP